MKACPTCKRTYSDETLTFCLVDGSILSAPYDPHDTVRIPPTQVTSPARTEILNQPPPPRPPDSRPPLLSTIQSPQPAPVYPAKRETPPGEKRNGKHGVGIGIGIALVLVFVAGTIISIVWLMQDKAAVEQTDSKVPNSNLRPTPTPTPMPTATVEAGGWGMRNEQAGLTGERITYYPGTTPEKCQKDCDANTRCKAYTYIREGFYNPSDPPMCYLMSAAYDFTPSPCCISAIKQ